MSVSTVTGTVQDPSGQVFANGTWQLIFKPNFSAPGPSTDGGVSFTMLYGGSLDAAGSFSQANVNRNDTISPAGSKWTLVVFPNANGQAFSVDLNVNSGAFSSTAAINAIITNIAVNATSIARAYKDTEVVPVPGSGGLYFDTTRKTLKAYDPTTTSWLEFASAFGEVLLNPAGNASQTITGPLGLSTFGLTAATVAANGTAASTFKNLESIRFADAFAAGSNSGGIAEAYAALPSNGGTVMLGADITIATAQVIQLVIQKPLFLNMNGRVITCTNTTGTALTFLKPDSDVRYMLQISNGTITYGGASNTITGLALGANPSNPMTNILVSNMVIQHFNTTGSIGLDLFFVEEGHFDLVNFNDNTLALKTEQNTVNNQFSNCYWQKNVNNFLILDSWSQTFIDCLFQHATGVRANQIQASAVNVFGQRFIGCWFEDNGDSTNSSRQMYIQAAAGKVISRLEFNGCTFNTGPLTPAGSTIFEFAGPGTLTLVHMEHNSVSGISNVQTGFPNGAGTIVINDGFPVYDVGLCANGSDALGIFGLSFAPATSSKQWLIYGGSPNVGNDGSLVVRDITADVNILLFNSSTWSFAGTLINMGVAGFQISGGTAFTGRTGIGANLVSDNAPIITGTSLVKRVRFNQGTAYTATDGAIVLSAGWGTTRTVSVATGFDDAFSFSVNATGTGQAASPTITITFKDGTWTTAPQVIVLRNDIITPFNTPPHTIAVTATTLTITFNGTPTAANVYSYIVMCKGV